MKELTTPRLRLRPFAPSDTDAYTAMMTQTAVTAYLGSGKAYTPEMAQKALAHFASAWAQNGYGVFAVEERATGRLIGHCGFAPLKDGRIELLYAFDPSAWGKGYATESGRAALDFAGAEYAWRRVYALAYPQNTKSAAVLAKLGFSECGQQEHFGALLKEYCLALEPRPGDGP